MKSLVSSEMKHSMHLNDSIIHDITKTRPSNVQRTFHLHKMSHLVEKPTMWFPNRSDTNRPVQAQKIARSLKFRIYVEEELYYPSSENKGADQLRGSASLFSPMQIVGFPMRRLK